MDWNLLRSFVAVADAGSLSAAARAEGSSQPTLGRHIAQLEEDLGVTLFARHARGLELTDEGASLYELADEVRQGVSRFERKAVGMDPGVEGTVRVSASQVVAMYALPSIMTGLRAAYPGIDLEIVANNHTSNLLRRDADIAVRMFQPTQLNLVAKKVADAPLGFYAAKSYLERHGRPTSFVDLAGHTLIGYDLDDLHLRTARRMGLAVERETFAVRCDDQCFHVNATLEGLGIGSLQSHIMERYEHIERVMPGVELSGLPVWMVAHQDVRRSPRIRVVFDWLSEGLAEYYSTS